MNAEETHMDMCRKSTQRVTRALTRPWNYEAAAPRYTQNVFRSFLVNISFQKVTQ